MHRGRSHVSERDPQDFRDVHAVCGFTAALLKPTAGNNLATPGRMHPVSFGVGIQIKDRVVREAGRLEDIARRRNVVRNRPLWHCKKQAQYHGPGDHGVHNHEHTIVLEFRVPDSLTRVSS